MSRNKIIIIALAILLCATTAQAEVLCITKRVSVSNSTLKLGKKIKVAAKKCPKKFKQIYNFNRLIKSKADVSNLSSYVSKDELIAVLSKYSSADEVASLKEALAQNTVEVADIVAALATKADASTVKTLATKAEVESVNTALAGKADTTALENLATKDEANAVSTALAGKADTTALENLATKDEVNAVSTALAGKADTTALENLATKDEVSAVNTALEGKIDADDVYTKEEVDNAVATVEDRVSTLETNQDDNSYMLNDLAGHYDVETGAFDFSNDSIPAGKTITGVSYIYFHDASGYEAENRYGVAELPTMAPSDILIGGEEQCTGNGENPTAAEGYFCVYKLNIPADDNYCKYTVEASKIGNSRQGVLIHIGVARNGGNRTCYGSKTTGNGVVAWAYTAPASTEGNN